MEEQMCLEPSERRLVFMRRTQGDKMEQEWVGRG